MGIVAWIILGLATGIAASRLAPDSRPRAPALFGITGMAGAVLGGVAATLLISGQLAGGFLSPATWPAAVAGAALLLLTRRLLADGSRNGTGRPCPCRLAGPGNPAIRFSDIPARLRSPVSRN